MGPRIVVTGSEGFVGKHLRQALQFRSCEVIGIDRPGTGAELELDLCDSGLDLREVARRCGQVEGVIAMAATITRGSSVDGTARANLRVIADSTVLLFEAVAEACGAAHFVMCSTYKSYGPADAGEPIDPEHPPQRPDPHSYGCAKALAERLLAISAARTGARYAVVRPTCIYGPGQHLHNAIPLFLEAAWKGQAPVVFGDGHDVRDDVFAPDLAFCLAEACLRRAEGAFHAAGERSRTILEVAELCCQVVAELGGPAGLEPIIDRRRAPKWWLDQRFDLERTRSLLGYRPTALAEGLRAEALWIKDGGRAERAPGFAPAPTRPA
jgi:nucleoside-diphosphate-sugar epimerase